MPADMDITVVSSARNGTYRGTRVFRGGNGVREDVVVTLLPVASGGQDEPITLPWDKTYSMATTGELDRYLLTMAAGPGFSVRVGRAGTQHYGNREGEQATGEVTAATVDAALQALEAAVAPPAPDTPTETPATPPAKQ